MCHFAVVGRNEHAVLSRNISLGKTFLPLLDARDWDGVQVDTCNCTCDPACEFAHAYARQAPNKRYDRVMLWAARTVDVRGV